MLAHLAKVDCRLLFATHYHGLTQEFAADLRVRLAHMGALVHAPQAQQAITFLYSLAPGACPRSYGLEVCLCLHSVPLPCPLGGGLQLRVYTGLVLASRLRCHVLCICQV